MPYIKKIIRLGFLSASILLGACTGDSAESMLLSAKQKLEKHDTKAAAIQLKNVLQKNPKSSEARFLLGKLMLDSGDPVGAGVELSKAQELGYSPDLVIPQLAAALVALGQFDKAIAYSTKTLQTPASQAELETVLANAYLAKGNQESAQAAIESALRSDPANVHAQLLNARALAAANDVTAANQQLNKIMAAAPENAEAWMIRGDILLSAGSVDEALDAYRQVLARDKTSLPAYSAMILTLINKGDPAGAKVQLQSLHAVLPEHPQTRFLTAVVAMNLGDMKLASEQSQQLLKQAPANVRALQLAGQIELRQGLLVQAESNLSKALQLAPDQVQVRLLLAQTHLGAGEPAKAIKVLQALMAPTGSIWEANALMGQALLLQGDVAAATPFLVQAAKLNPKDSRSRSALAVYQIVKGNSLQGFGDLQAIAVSDKGLTADLALIAAYLQNKDFMQALKAVDQLEKKQPKLPLAANLRGQIELAQGSAHRERARHAFESAILLDPSFFPAAASLAVMDLADGKPDQARQRFEKVLQSDPRSLRASMALLGLRGQAGATSDELAEMAGKVIRAHPTEAEPRVVLVRLNIGRKDFKQALNVAQDGIAALPGNVEILDVLGLAQYANGDFNQAVKTYNELASLQPTSPQPLMRLADIYLGRQDLAAAGQSIKKALIIKPDFLPAQRAIIVLELNSNHYKEALGVARTVQKQRPEEQIGFALEGDIFSVQKNWTAALAAFRNGLSRQPNSELAIKLHRVLVSAGKPDDANKFEQQWLNEHPHDIQFLNYSGDLALNRLDTAVAQSRFETVVKLQPNQAIALNNLAWLRNRAKQPGALDFALRATKLAPKEAAFLDTLAEVYSTSGQGLKAIDAQRAAVAAAPDSPNFRLRLARLYLSVGDKISAKQELNRLAVLGIQFAQQAEVKALLAKL